MCVASGGLPSGPGGMDPRMLAGMIAAMPPEQRAALAASMGVTEEQLGQVAQMMASGMIGSDEDMGDDDGDGEGGPVPPGATVIRLTEAEAAAVERVSLSVPFPPQYPAHVCLCVCVPSCKALVSLATKRLRRTLRAIRTNNWRPTSCWRTCDTVLVNACLSCANPYQMNGCHDVVLSCFRCVCGGRSLTETIQAQHSATCMRSIPGGTPIMKSGSQKAFGHTAQ